MGYFLIVKMIYPYPEKLKNDEEANANSGQLFDGKD